MTSVKYLIGLWLTVGLTCSLCAAPVKRALLIGIANYQAAGHGWPNTPANRDLLLMQATLQEQGFLKANIGILANQNATYAGIERRMNTFIASLRPGDMVVILFSGHGQQVPDDNGDEVDDEGTQAYDEAFVPFDAPSESTQTDKYIRDDRISLWIAQIRKQIGGKGHLLLLMDSCYSGTINRGDGSVRGGKAPVPSPVHQKRTVSIKGTGETGSGYLDKKVILPPNQGIGRFILMTGCQPNQLNYDIEDEQGKPIGALTYAVSCAFRQLERNDNYIRLFHKAAAYINPYKQNPTLEGDTTQTVFGGNFTVYQPTFSLTSIKNAGGQMVEVAAGFVSGVFNRAKMVFYPKTGQARGSAPIARGHVVNASLTHSWIKIDSGRISDQPSGIKAVELEKAFGSWRVSVDLSNKLPTALRRALAQALRKRATVLLTEKGELRIEPSGKQLLLRYTGTGLAYDSVRIDDPEAVAFCVDRITDYGQARLIRQLSLTNPHYAIHADFVPVHVQKDSSGAMQVVDTLNAVAKNAFPYFTATSQGQLTIYNDGDQDVYITLIDIPPDSRLRILLPAEDQPDGFLIPAGQRSEPIFLAFEEPFGTEVYKIIATPKPLKVQLTVASRGVEQDSEADNPFTILLGNSYRGETPASMPLSEISTTTLTFRVGPNF